MRIIAGRFRSRKLKAVDGTPVRPTPDRLRETLFDILAPQIEGSTFLDAYAGSGAVGLEALSRGAKHVVLIENSAAAMSIIRDNLAALQVEKEVTAIRGKATALLAKFPCDLAFIDPPYVLTSDYERSLNLLDGSICRLAIAQHSSRFQLRDRYGHLAKARVVRQGDNSLSFYSRSEAEPETLQSTL